MPYKDMSKQVEANKRYRHRKRFRQNEAQKLVVSRFEGFLNNYFYKNLKTPKIPSESVPYIVEDLRIALQILLSNPHISDEKWFYGRINQKAIEEPNSKLVR